jgi:RND family efflux transporter MFP subunit
VKVDPRDAENNLKEGLAVVAGLRAALGWEEGQGAFDAEQQPEVCAAKASLGLAKTNFDRYSSLLAQHAVQQAAFDQAKTQYETAQQQVEQSLRHAQQLYQNLLTALARVDILEKAVADTTIEAPFSGWIAAKYVSEGERVATSPMGPGSKVVSLVSVDPLRLVLTVPQQEAAVVHQGQQVTFTVETFPDRKFTGEVKYIAPSLETNSRSLSIEAMVANTDKVLRPGFFASAELALPGTTDRLLLPASAVVKVGEVYKVYVLRDGKAIEKVVDVAETQGEGDRVIVKSGITADDAVIVSPDTLPKTDEVKP